MLLNPHTPGLLFDLAREQRDGARVRLARLVLFREYRTDQPAKWDMVGAICCLGPTISVQVMPGAEAGKPKYDVRNAWVRVEDLSS